MRRHSVPYFWLLLMAGSHAASAAEPVRPDLVIFLTDDHSQRDATPYGSTTLRTPHMQRLADEGLTFTHAYVASPRIPVASCSLMTRGSPLTRRARMSKA